MVRIGRSDQLQNNCTQSVMWSGSEALTKCTVLDNHAAHHHHPPPLPYQKHCMEPVPLGSLHPFAFWGLSFQGLEETSLFVAQTPTNSQTTPKQDLLTCSSSRACLQSLMLFVFQMLRCTYQEPLRQACCVNLQSTQSLSLANGNPT